MRKLALPILIVVAAAVLSGCHGDDGGGGGPVAGPSGKGTPVGLKQTSAPGGGGGAPATSQPAAQ